MPFFRARPFTFSGIGTTRLSPASSRTEYRDFESIISGKSRTIEGEEPDSGMPRFRPMAKLERSALADLWKYTLSRIPTACGRLAYLASLRDPQSGAYKHHGLIASFGRDEAVRALRDSHQKEFQEWLKLPLAEKNEDLRDYLIALDNPQDEVVDYWVKSGIYRSYVPAGALPVETDLFCRDLETLLAFLKHDALRRRQRSGGELRDLDSSQPA